MSVCEQDERGGTWPPNHELPLLVGPRLTPVGRTWPPIRWAAQGTVQYIHAGHCRPSWERSTTSLAVASSDSFLLLLLFSLPFFLHNKKFVDHVAL